MHIDESGGKDLSFPIDTAQSGESCCLWSDIDDAIVLDGNHPLEASITRAVDYRDIVDSDRNSHVPILLFSNRMEKYRAMFSNIARLCILASGKRPEGDWQWISTMW
jgi:hypothetical protein